jgi:hypothetical protein
MFVVKSASTGKSFGLYKTAKEAVSVAASANDLQTDGTEDWAPAETEEKAYDRSDLDELKKFKNAIWDANLLNIKLKDPKLIKLHQQLRDSLLLVIGKLPV